MKVYQVILEEIDELHKSVCFGVNTEYLKLRIFQDTALHYMTDNREIVLIAFNIIRREFHQKICMHWHTVKLENRIMTPISLTGRTTPS